VCSPPPSWWTNWSNRLKGTWLWRHVPDPPGAEEQAKERPHLHDVPPMSGAAVGRAHSGDRVRKAEKRLAPDPLTLSATEVEYLRRCRCRWRAGM
jgi:hypothetical protein